MSIYFHAEVECVCGAETPPNACLAHTETTLQIPDFTENTELDSYLKSGFYILIVTNDGVFSTLNWWTGCCIFVGLYEPPVTFSATLLEAVWIM